ncbi:hypothetical protein GobsT_33660 [Gemmata obscuriglobus]|uniref:Uncharacterized protein n=1 Tax=Gemmata obscuriglobus TaxID=114 RepID=A0A2Z3HB88_9BACT
MAFLADNQGYHATNHPNQEGRSYDRTRRRDRQCPSLSTLTDHLLDFVRHAAERGQPAHEVERGIWDQVLKLGRAAFARFLALSGTGDVGPEVPLPDGSSARRLPTTHTREYRSVFGDFTLTRTCYGPRDGQKIVLVPLDNRLQVPDGAYSYLL